MFHFSRYGLAELLDSPGDVPLLNGTGFPIRKSPDHSLLTAPRSLSQLHHVLHRLLAPRHPLEALSSLTKNGLRLSGNHAKGVVFPIRRSIRRTFRDLNLPIFSCQRAKTKPFDFLSKKTPRCGGRGDNRTRTGNLLRARQTLWPVELYPLPAGASHGRKGSRKSAGADLPTGWWA